MDMETGQSRLSHDLGSRASRVTTMGLFCPGGGRMITRFCIWWLGADPTDEYIRGWSAGVVQHKHDPDSCIALRLDGGEWPTYEQYWGLD